MKRNTIRMFVTGAAVGAAATMCLAAAGPETHEAELQGIAKSQSSKIKTGIKFVNNSGKPVKIYWLDTNGHRQLMKELKDDREAKFDTFLTHPWLVVDKDDNAKAIYWPDTEPQTVKLK